VFDRQTNKEGAMGTQTHHPSHRPTHFTATHRTLHAHILHNTSIFLWSCIHHPLNYLQAIQRTSM
jgi:hypothetical protein